MDKFRNSSDSEEDVEKAERPISKGKAIKVGNSFWINRVKIVTS